MTKVVFTDISYFIEEDDASQNTVLRRLRTCPATIAAQVEDALPASVAMKMMIGVDTHRDAIGIGFGLRMRDEVSGCFLIHVTPKGNTLHVADLSAGVQDQGHGSKMMLSAVPVLYDIFKPTHQTLDAEGTGRHYWVRAHQQMTADDRAMWQRLRAEPFAKEYREALDPDTYDLLMNPKASTAVLAALDDPDPTGQFKDVGHALFLGFGAPTFECRTVLNNTNRRAADRFYHSRAQSSIRPLFDANDTPQVKLRALRHYG